MRKLPIGIQTFEYIRKGDYIYVDKTRKIYEMVKSGKFYFLSRPRRFGKSLLISTLEELFKGNKKLFEGLYIYDKWDWSKKSPVIHLDFTEIQYSTVEQLEISLENFLDDAAKRENIELEETPIRLIGVKFARLIEKLHKKTGEQVAILVDEYDKPLIDNLSNKDVYPKIKRTLHDFYQVIKASDEHEEFVILTGVSQFSGLSIFSGLNNLNDITMNAEYGTICGYTQENLEESFKEYIEKTTKVMEIKKEELLSEIKNWYNGYSWDGKTSVYNPFSTLLFFSNKEFSEYWFKTGTPTFLMEQIKRKEDLESFVKPQMSLDRTLKGNNSEDPETMALLFQTGYLTVKKKEYIDRTIWYTIDFPNYEVKSAFLSSLMKEYTLKKEEEINGINKRIGKALKEKKAGELEKGLIELLANIAYDLQMKKEKYYHSLFLIAGSMSGYEVESEAHTDKGRIDAVLKKDKEVIVVEIKYEKGSKVEELLEEAMEQIKEKKYYEKYVSNKVSLLAVAFGDNKEIACKFQKLV